MDKKPTLRETEFAELKDRYLKAYERTLGAQYWDAEENPISQWVGSEGSSKISVG